MIELTEIQQQNTAQKRRLTKAETQLFYKKFAERSEKLRLGLITPEELEKEIENDENYVDINSVELWSDDDYDRINCKPTKITR
jgi:hypothetical protein